MTRCPMCSPADYRIVQREAGGWNVLNRHGRVVRVFATLHEAEQWIIGGGR